MVRTIAAVGLALLATCAPPHASFPKRITRPTRFAGLRVRADHPRIWLDPARVEWLRAKVLGRDKKEVAELAGGSLPGMALASVATGDGTLCHSAFERHVVHRTENTRLVHLALFYDWCHAHLSSDEKAKLRAILAPQMREDMANGRLWRSFHNAGHEHAFMLTTSALALQGDDKVADEALDFLPPELDDMLETFDRVFPDGEWAEGVDYARHASHHALRTFLALKSATGQDLIAESPHLRNAANYIFYATKPNGLVFNGDDNDYPYLSSWEHRALLMYVSEYRDPYAQWFLSHCPVKRFELEEKDRWEQLLWYDATIAERPLDELPLARIFRGKGVVLARSGWGFGDGSTWVAFANGDYFGDHTHLDVNAFQIHHKGDLAIDSGRYDDDWDFTGKPDKIARSQFFNYYQRTIAHNTMLVFDPNETFGPGLVNDGGQRHHLWRGTKRDRNVPEDYAQGNFPSDDGVGTSDWTTNPGRWERGDITAYTTTPDFVFVRGDGAKAYAPEKLSAFVRELVFVRPRVVVVFDRVVATNASFEKTWLLHTVNEPLLDDATFEVKEGEGRLFGITVLPERRRLKKVGGTEDEMLVRGTRFHAGPRSELNPSPLHYGETPGAWRIELSPAEPRVEDYFANVMMVTDRDDGERPRIEVVKNDGSELVLRVGDAKSTVTLGFTKGDRPKTSLAIDRSGKTVFNGVLPDSIVLEEGRR